MGHAVLNDEAGRVVGIFCPWCNAWIVAVILHDAALSARLWLISRRDGEGAAFRIEGPANAAVHARERFRREVVDVSSGATRRRLITGIEPTGRDLVAEDWQHEIWRNGDRLLAIDRAVFCHCDNCLADTRRWRLLCVDEQISAWHIYAVCSKGDGAVVSSGVDNFEIRDPVQNGFIVPEGICCAEFDFLQIRTVVKGAASDQRHLVWQRQRMDLCVGEAPVADFFQRLWRCHVLHLCARECAVVQLGDAVWDRVAIDRIGCRVGDQLRAVGAQQRNALIVELERGVAVSDGDLFQAVAFFKRIAGVDPHVSVFADRGKRRWQIDLLQRLTVDERVGADARHAFGNDDAFNVVHPGKCVRPDRRHTWLDHNVLKFSKRRACRSVDPWRPHFSRHARAVVRPAISAVVVFHRAIASDDDGVSFIIREHAAVACCRNVPGIGFVHAGTVAFVSCQHRARQQTSEQDQRQRADDDFPFHKIFLS